MKKVIYTLTKRSPLEAVELWINEESSGSPSVHVHSIEIRNGSVDFIVVVSEADKVSKIERSITRRDFLEAITLWIKLHYGQQLSPDDIDFNPVYNEGMSVEIIELDKSNEALAKKP